MHAIDSAADQSMSGMFMGGQELTAAELAAYTADPIDQPDDPNYGPETAEPDGTERNVRKGGRRYNFRMMPDHVLWHPELTPSEKDFYLKLMFLMGNNDTCTYSVPFMAAACGVSDRAIQKWEKKLESLGLLVREFRKREGSPNRNDNNALTLVEEPDEEPDYPFRRKDVTRMVKDELRRRREEAAKRSKKPR